MKLLIDQNISHRITQKIIAVFGNVSHVRDFGMNNQSDPEIFMFARREGYSAIITLDEDFSFLLKQHGAPPKIVWIRTGNCSTVFLANLLIVKKQEIAAFIESEHHSCMEIFG